MATPTFHGQVSPAVGYGPTMSAGALASVEAAAPARTARIAICHIHDAIGAVIPPQTARDATTVPDPDSLSVNLRQRRSYPEPDPADFRDPIGIETFLSRSRESQVGSASHAPSYSGPEQVATDGGFVGGGGPADGQPAGEPAADDADSAGGTDRDRGADRAGAGEGGSPPEAVAPPQGQERGT